jgi:ATP-dependent DNA helicase RecG
MQPARLNSQTDIQYFKGVGPVRAQALRRLGIHTAGDLLHHYPHDYEQPSAFVPLAQVVVGQRVRTAGKLLHVDKRRARGRTIVSALLADSGARLRIVWFNAPWVFDQLHVGATLRLLGEVTRFGDTAQLVNPEFDAAESEAAASGLRARYPLSAGLRQASLRKWIARALDTLLPESIDPLPPTLLREEALLSWAEAMRGIHRPRDLAELERARERLGFDEALALHLAVAQRRAHHLRRKASFQLGEFGQLSTALVAQLGFELTQAQRRALGAIARDLRSPIAMHRLLQGDVGSGKTLVALIPMIWVAESGAQAAFMAPTEVLARQQAERWLPRLRELGLRAELLLGSTPAGEKSEILAALRSGAGQLLFGTHALIQEGVEFARLGLAVVDEQHRFGVLQRADLAAQGAHLLVMSATPIPRSLGLTVFGDLDLSILDELPAGRQPIRTQIVAEADLPLVYGELIAAAARGERSYLVFPMVQESESSDLASAVAAHAELARGALSGLRVGLLHGQLPPREKAAISRAFANGELDALVATTVIEVGLDVAAATQIVIHQAERFGLAQLHQLRGRVGRGRAASRCYLVPSPACGEAGRRRLQTVASTQDGFRLAEEDLRQRGMGELHGLRQHGDWPFRILDPLADELLLERARQCARRLLAQDPKLASPPLRPVRLWLEALGHRSPLWSGAG